VAEVGLVASRREGRFQYFAQATGQRVTVPEGRSGGNFADAVAAGPDAGVMHRLIAFTGRYVPVGGTSST
jgi:hypothetical protein